MSNDLPDMLRNSITKLSNTILRSWSAQVCAAILVFAFSLSVDFHEAEAQQLTSGSSSRQFREEVLRAFPMERLNQQTLSKLQPVLEKPSIYRRLPKMAIECDPDYFRFLVRYPEVIVEIWKLMGVTKMDTVRTAAWSVETNDGAGTLSDLELVYGDANKHIFYGTGTYEGSLIRKKLGGRCVLILETQHVTDENGKPKAISQLDVFLKVDNAAAGMIAKTLSPIVGSTADHNFMESLRFVQRLNETTLKNGKGVQLMGHRLTLSPEVLKGFQDVAGQAYRRGQQTAVPTEFSRVSSGPQVRSFRSR